MIAPVIFISLVVVGLLALVVVVWEVRTDPENNTIELRPNTGSGRAPRCPKCGQRENECQQLTVDR